MTEFHGVICHRESCRTHIFVSFLSFSLFLFFQSRFLFFYPHHKSFENIWWYIEGNPVVGEMPSSLGLFWLFQRTRAPTLNSSQLPVNSSSRGSKHAFLVFKAPGWERERRGRYKNMQIIFKNFICILVYYIESTDQFGKNEQTNNTKFPSPRTTYIIFAESLISLTNTL